MAKKKSQASVKKVAVNAEIEGAGIIIDQPITQTIQQNYMPYAMSVIISRALPEIDGFKPSHRKILYTMYKMGLLTKPRTKSANIVGQTMKLNPHGDQAIYETMVRLSRGNEALLHPYIDSKGNFGKSYSRDMAYAASRYTEAKLDAICDELFRDIDKDTVDFVPNYDNETTEPTLLPTTFPTILLNSNVGIAVSMASCICPFNLKELCETTIGLLKNENYNIRETLLGPDFAGGGYILYDDNALDQIYHTGRGSLKVRGKYLYDKALNCIEITQIPPTTTIETIMDKIVDLIKQNKVREIADMRDETDLSGLKITLDLKRGVDPDKLMQKLFRMTPLQDNFSCNFNILIAGQPKVMGVREILQEWIAFRCDCVRRRIFFDLKKQKEKLHLLKGLEKILLDIDKAIKIIRETKEEREVVSNLMIGFGIDEIQAEYVAEIKLRHLNKEYILKRIQEIEQLTKSILEMEDILENPKKVKSIIISELRGVMRKHAKPRQTQFIFAEDIKEIEEAEEIPNYPVHIFLTQHGYFKKITPQSLRMSGEHKLKETDQMIKHIETTNDVELLFFTDKHQVYKARAYEFDDTKASLLGDYIPAKLGFDEGEKLISMVVTKNYQGNILFFFDNGKAAKVPIAAYETKTKRKKLSNAYCDKFQLISLLEEEEHAEYIVVSSTGRKLLVAGCEIPLKATRNNQGIQIMTLKKNQTVESVTVYQEGMLSNPARFRTKVLPGLGILLKNENQLKLI